MTDRRSSRIRTDVRAGMVAVRVGGWFIPFHEYVMTHPAISAREWAVMLTDSMPLFRGKASQQADMFGNRTDLSPHLVFHLGRTA